MNQVHILVPGYAHPGENGIYIACPTCVLIDTDGQRVIVDPGTNSEKLLMALDNLNLKTIDISYVYLSHYHPDHFLNLRLFPGIDLVDGTMIWRGDQEISYQNFLPGTEIKLLPTPGHSPEDTTLLVKTDEGIVAIAPDVFWWEDGSQKSDTVENLLNHIDQFASDVEALKNSRQKVLEVADWIIPGHGRKFKNPAKK